MLRIASAALAAIILTAGAAYADPIEGNWKTQAGSTATIARCGGSFCITLVTGQHAGKRIGTFKPGAGGKYTGEITDPANDKTYNGEATLSGGSISMRGCVLGGLICRSQNWSKL